MKSCSAAARRIDCRQSVDEDMAMVIRQSTVHDAEPIGKLAAEFQTYLRALGDRTEFDWGATKYLRDGFSDDPAFEGLVAETKSEVVAYLLYHFGYDTDRGQRLVHVIDLYVAEDFRRRGIGAALMKRAAAIGRARGAEAMFWSVYKPNDVALRFYEKLGATHASGLHFMSLAI